MGRAPCCEKNGQKKGPWTTEEDIKLTQYIEEHGPGNWRILPKIAGLERCGKSCRLRWTNYLRPDIKRGRFSFEEEETIIQLHSVWGNKWSAIAARLPGRTDNEIKNYWNTHIRKRLSRMGLDPVTHTPKFDHLIGSSSQLNILSNLLVALNQKQQQQQQLVNPQLLSIVASLLNPLNQQIPQNQVMFGNNNNISVQQQNQTSWQQLFSVDHSNSIIDNNPPVLFPPHNYSSSCFMSQQPQLNVVMQPNDNGVKEDCLTAEMRGCGLEVASGDHNQQVTQDLHEQTYPVSSASHDKQFSFNPILSTPLTTSSSSSPLNSSFTSNGWNHDDCTSFFNFEFPEEFDMSELL